MGLRLETLGQGGHVHADILKNRGLGSGAWGLGLGV